MKPGETNTIPLARHDGEPTQSLRYDVAIYHVGLRFTRGQDAVRLAANDRPNDRFWR